MPIVILVLFDNEDNSYIVQAPLAFCRSSYLLGGIIDVVGWGHCCLILAYAQVGRSESDDFVDDDDDDDDDKGIVSCPTRLSSIFQHPKKKSTANLLAETPPDPKLTGCVTQPPVSLAKLTMRNISRKTLPEDIKW